MSKFLFTTGAADGHVNVCTTIVKKLVTNGHEVAWITGRLYKEKVESVGAIFYPLPKSFDPEDVEIYDYWPELRKRKGLNQIKYYLKHVFLDNTQELIETINVVLQSFPADVVVGDTIMYAAYFNSELGGPPSAMISLLPLTLPSKDTAPFGFGFTPGNSWLARVRNQILNLLFDHIIMRDVNAYMNRIRRNLGLPYSNKTLFRLIHNLPSMVLQISTPAFEYSRSDLPDNIKFVGPILLDPAQNYIKPSWWEDLNNRKVVLVNQGTVAKDLKDLIIPSIQGLKDEDLLVITVPVVQGELDSIPLNVRAEKFIPFDQILPNVDIMISNGGYGGTQMALAYGIPLVLAGATDDKMEVSARVEWAGAGINLRKSRPMPVEIRSAVKTVLSNPQYKNNAEKIQREFQKHDGASEASELLESLVPKKSNLE